MDDDLNKHAQKSNVLNKDLISSPWLEIKGYTSLYLRYST